MRPYWNVHTAVALGGLGVFLSLLSPQLGIAQTTARTGEDPLVLEMEQNPSRFFNRRIVVRDRSGLNEARLLVVSNDRDAVDIFAESGIRLIVDAEEEDEAIREAQEASGAEDFDDDEETEDRIRVLIFEEGVTLEPGRRNYVVMASPRTELKLPWKNYYHYTYKDCAEVTRLKLGRRVYVSMWSKQKSNSAWSTLLSNDKLAHKETVSRCDHGTYQLKTRVRTKKSNAYSYGAFD